MALRPMRTRPSRAGREGLVAPRRWSTGARREALAGGKPSWWWGIRHVTEALGSRRGRTTTTPLTGRTVELVWRVGLALRPKGTGRSVRTGWSLRTRTVSRSLSCSQRPSPEYDASCKIMALIRSEGRQRKSPHGLRFQCDNKVYIRNISSGRNEGQKKDKNLPQQWQGRRA